MLLQPERAFEIEIVGRLVEQQQVGLGEQRGGERHAHAPAAGEFRARRAAGRRSEKPRPERIEAARAGAACAPMSASRVWISAMRCGSLRGFGFGQQRARSASALSTMSIRLSGPSGASCASRPMRQRGGRSHAAVLGRDDRRRSRRTAWSCRCRCGRRGRRGRRSEMRAEAPSSSARPAMRTVRSSMTSMARLLAERGGRGKPARSAQFAQAPSPVSR